MFGLNSIAKFIHHWRQPRKREIAAFQAWANENAIMLDPLDGVNTDIEKLAFLDELLAGKRVIYLGEEDHWIHEKNEFRLLLIRYLFSRGWHFIGEELGWSDGMRIDRYLETGDETCLERIATYGYQGGLRTDRDDSPTGILKSSSENYPKKEFAAEQIRFAKELRKINENRPTGSARLQFFGFDIDALAGDGYEDIEELLKPARDTTGVVELRKLLARVPNESVEEEISRLNRGLEFIKKEETNLLNVLGKEPYDQLWQWTTTLRDSFEFVRIANTAKDMKTLNQAMAEREKAMYRHVKYMLAQIGPEEKLILMGHNRHLSKDIRLIKNAGGSPPGGKRVPSLGMSINQELPGEVFSIWMVFDHGKSSQPYVELSKEYVNHPGSLNALLAEVGEVFLLPTSSKEIGASLLAREMDIVGIYNVIFKTAIVKQADGIFFIREVSELRD